MVHCFFFATATIWEIDSDNFYFSQQLKEFEDKKLVCATEEGLKMEESEDEKKDF
jgi:molecular chaperone HtpG